jgi:hypothetical protein
VLPNNFRVRKKNLFLSFEFPLLRFNLPNCLLHFSFYSVLTLGTGLRRRLQQRDLCDSRPFPVSFLTAISKQSEARSREEQSGIHLPECSRNGLFRGRWQVLKYEKGKVYRLHSPSLFLYYRRAYLHSPFGVRGEWLRQYSKRRLRQFSNPLFAKFLGLQSLLFFCPRDQDESSRMPHFLCLCPQLLSSADKQAPLFWEMSQTSSGQFPPRAERQFISVIA